MRYSLSSLFSASFSLFQSGHIYTSSGSFLIEPQEKYAAENQNILHKITREKKLMVRNHSSGKIMDDIVLDDVEEIRHDSESKAAEAKPTDDDEKRGSLCDACNNEGNDPMI